MIIDLQKFIAEERPYWNELESELDRLEKRPELKLSLSRLERFHYLYQRTSGSLAKIKTFASEPNTRAFLGDKFLQIDDHRYAGSKVQGSPFKALGSGVQGSTFKVI